MRARVLILLVLPSLVASTLSSAATAGPDHHRRQSPTVARTEPGRVPDVHHIDPAAVAVGPGHPQIEDNFERLDHVAMPGRQAAADVYFFDHGARGKLAYVGSFRDPCTSDGVRIVDVTHPRSSAVAAVAPLSDGWNTSTGDVVVERVGARRILAGGLQACGRDGRNGLALWDVTRPRHPDLLSFLRTPAGVHELDLAVRQDGTVLALLATPFVEYNNTYFGSDAGGEFRIVDITRPANPQRRSSWGIICDSQLVTFGGDEIVSSFQGMDTFFTAIYATASETRMTAPPPTFPIGMPGYHWRRRGWRRRLRGRRLRRRLGHGRGRRHGGSVLRGPDRRLDGAVQPVRSDQEGHETPVPPRSSRTS